MNKLTLWFCSLSAVLALITASPAVAAGKKKKKPPPHINTISAVTADSVTIAEEKGQKTLAVTPFTEINVNGRKAQVTDLQPGMTVNVTLGTDPSKASRIMAGEAPVARDSKNDK